jgi:HlyD family secretion protein
MTSRKKILVGVILIAVLGSATALSIIQSNDRGMEVRMEEVALRDLVSTITVSGNVRARRSVDISADVMGRIIELNVEEGQEVTRGDILLRIDPSQLEASVSRAQASLSQAQAQVAQQRANLLQAERVATRMRALWDRDSTLVSPQQVEDAETSMEVARALFEAAEFGVSQAEAALEETRDQLAKTVIRAPMSGKITRLNVEEGETVVIGTMNNSGSLLLTISDLSVIEVVMEVDEVDVPEINLGDSAVVELDAYPDRQFTGRVTQIGQSSITPPSQAAGSATIDFEVVITLEDSGIQLRPDLSATADIVTAIRRNVLAIPIIALTVRQVGGAAIEREDTADSRSPEGPIARGLRGQEQEGVFLVRDGIATFTPVEVGITGHEFFEVLSGLEEGDTVVAGPYQRIRELTDGDPVRPSSLDVG